jgi:N-acetyl-gamma-glutamyl-phosphate reductase
MIKVGISGCDGLNAAELVRILINHPDVELMWVCSASHPNGRLDGIVPGIAGECDLRVSPEGKLDDVDVLFLCGSHDAVKDQMHPDAWREDLKVIDLSGAHNLDHGDGKPWVYGLGEMQRRVLVHEARWVTIPGTAAIASLLSLMPLARNQLLNSPLTSHVQAGAMVFPGGMTVDGLAPEAYAREQQQEVCYALEQCQPGFGQPVSLTVCPDAERRTLTVESRFKSDMSLPMLISLYEQYYEDHNFVFLMDRPITAADVENTNKFLIGIEKDEATGEVTVHGMMDALLKGSAGTAVHTMNLMFGLFERVGLALKATGC